MNKKGFTLVELLAVIAILAILVIIALPNVMGMFNSAKKESFTTEIKEIYKVAEQTWMSESMFNTSEVTYSRCKTCAGKSLDLSGRTELEYYIKINKSGKVVEFYATDGTYQYTHEGELQLTDIKLVKSVADLDDDERITISSSGSSTVSDSKYVCKRATTLHYGICENGEYAGQNSARNFLCVGSHLYNRGDAIKYGSLGTSGVLNPGDAFDCDVNGDGSFDSSTERFYYISRKDANNNSDYAVLLYYSNVTNGQPNNTDTYAYGDIWWGGPNIGYEQLPSTTQWKRVSLSENVRQIKNKMGGATVEYDGSTMNLKTFDYSGKAARFLTALELTNACSNISSDYGMASCPYIFENSAYADPHTELEGFMLESYSRSYNIMFTFAEKAKVDANAFSSTVGGYGVRPAIEVPLSQIKY